MKNGFWKMLVVSSMAVAMIFTGCERRNTARNAPVTEPPSDISVTVTGIPEEYHGLMPALMFETHTGTGEEVHLATAGCRSLGGVTEAWTFEMNEGDDGTPGQGVRFNEAGDYTLSLLFFDLSSFAAVAEYNLHMTVNAGTNSIPFGEFTRRETAAAVY